MVTQLVDLWEQSTFAFFCVLAACLYLIYLAVLLSIIDIRTHTLPNRYVLPAYAFAGIPLAVSALAVGNPGQLLRVLAGAVALGAFYWILWAVYPAGMGFGDVKLAGVLGLYLGFLSWTHVLIGAAAGFVVGGLWGVVLIISRRGNSKSHIPFGPSMLSGVLVAMLLIPA